VQIYLPIAEMSIAVEQVVALGVFVGFISGVFGVGGGFLTTPLLIFMGIPPAVAVGTQGSQLVASGVSGVMGYWRKGNVDFLIGTVMLCGGLAGALLGMVFFTFIQYIGQVDLMISILYILVLGTIGLMMLFESVLSAIRTKTVKSEFNRLKPRSFIANLPYKMRFPHSKLYISAFVPGGIGFISGFLVSTMGVGGGFFIVQAMIYILGMPTLLVSGTSLFQIIFISAFTTIMHATLNHSVDVMLALLLITGGVVGTRIGVKVSKKITGTKARIILALMVLAVSGQLAAKLFIEPANHFVVEVR
jgi:uncharacterized membrane protein YfcA